jgi:hypothetical protein
MPGGLGPRFFVEAAFLILLAVGLALADQSTRTIVIVMAVAWAIVAAFEWVTWRDAGRYLEQGPYAWRADRLAPPWPEERPVDPYAQIVVPAPPPEPAPVVEAEPAEPAAEDLTEVVPPAAARRRWLGLRRARGDAALAEEEAPPTEDGAAE